MMPQEPPMPMGDGEMGGGGMPPADAGMDGFGGQPEENQFDTNFDAGVEANEDEDPKKYIQQLTGKLSQTLRSYNQNLPQPDADLNKFVAGMIVKQAVEGLSPEDANDILNKVQNDEGEEMDAQEPQQDMGDPNGGDMGGGMEMGESFNRTRRGELDELFGQVLQDEEETKEPPTSRKPGDITYRQKPYTSPF